MAPHKLDTHPLHRLAAIADARIPCNPFRRWGAIGFGFGSGDAGVHAGVMVVGEAMGGTR